MTIVILGADPGPTSGLAWLQLERLDGVLAITDRIVLSCNSAAVITLAGYLLELAEAATDSDPDGAVIAAGEKFVPGKGAGGTGWQAAVTRKVIADLSTLGAHPGVQWQWHTASESKNWATDARLRASGLYDITAKMIDGRDAARIALFAAVKYAGLPDPLSRKRRT